jgi:hypothetical protein
MIESFHTAEKQRRQTLPQSLSPDRFDFWSLPNVFNNNWMAQVPKHKGCLAQNSSQTPIDRQ